MLSYQEVKVISDNSLHNRNVLFPPTGQDKEQEEEVEGMG